MTVTPDLDSRFRAAALDAGLVDVRYDLVATPVGELFVAAYGADGGELIAPSAVPLGEVRARILGVEALRGALFVGEVAAKLEGHVEALRGHELDLPHAHAVAALGAVRDPERSPPEPIYVRGVGATLPKLSPSPLTASHFEKDP